MPLRLSTSLLCTALAISGCDQAVDLPPGPQSFPLIKTDATTSELTSEQLKAAHALSLRFALGSGWDGYNVLRIASDGKAEYCFRVSCAVDRDTVGISLPPEWRRATFDLSPEVLKALHQELTEIGFVAWPDAYHADVQDGTQAIVEVWLEGAGHKRVYFNNHFTGGFQQLHEFLNSRVLEPNAQALQKATVLTREETRAIFWEGL